MTERRFLTEDETEKLILAALKEKPHKEGELYSTGKARVFVDGETIFFKLSENEGD